MFNIGPLELLVLAVVGLIVIGPDKLPNLARDAARMIRTLRDMATGAREQLKDELGPEFADVDLRNLNPRTAVRRVILGDDDLDFSKLDPRQAFRDAVLGADETPAAQSIDTTEPASATAPVSVTKPSAAAATPYDEDAT